MDKVIELADTAGMCYVDAHRTITCTESALHKFYTLARADLEAEMQEQCRIIGIGAERELKLEADLAATRDLAEGYAQERNELKAENAKLQKANKMLDTALCRAYPYGCYNGDVAYLWNAARASLGDK